MANPRLRGWRKWAKKDWAIAAVGFTIILFALTLLFDSRNPTSSSSSTFNLPSNHLIPLTLLHRAKATGAFCLDGSLPGYHFQKGFGSGSNNWLLHIENGTKLFFRGQLIWEAIMSELLSLGLSQAKQALLTGCSAGGLATLIHCDDFRAHLPKDATVKCLADAGFFLDEPDILGNSTMSNFYHDVVQLQGVAKSLHKKCITEMEPSKCIFPQQIIKNIRTPLFIVNPTYDFWQIQHVLVPAGSDPDGYWRRCRLSIQKCDSTQIENLQGSFRSSLLKALSKLQHDKEGGMFINSCFVHCQTWMAETWHSSNSPRINNKTIAESVGDWYFNRKVTKEIDCPYPCNPTCYHMDFTQPS
ncbi:hypothetical protein Gotur_000008 [Gossypium turneri]